MNRDEFESWYRTEHGRVAAALYAFSGDADLALDATDEAFARALARSNRLNQLRNPTGWVYRVALNQLRRTFRRRAHERQLLFRLAEPEVGMPVPDRHVWDVVARLPERQRTAAVLRYVADLSEKEIASVMGINRGTVSSTLVDARKRLSEWLAEPSLLEEPS